MTKPVNVTSTEDLEKEVSDVEVFGNPDDWKLLCKASSKEQGWMKSTKAYEIDGMGCIVQVTTQIRNPDGSYTTSEAATFVPNVYIEEYVNEEDENKVERRLEPIGLKDEDDYEDDDE